LIAGVIAISAAAMGTGVAQHVSPALAPQSPSPHPPAPAMHSLVAPARNAIGLPAPSLAAGAAGPTHGPGLNGPGVNAAKTGLVGVGATHSVIPLAPAAPLTAKGALNGSQMGHRGTGAPVLGGGATHAPTAVVGHNASPKR
jgi:hypothetical protein